MNNIPAFIPNSPDNVHCVQAVFRMLYKHFFNQDYSWQEIDMIAKAENGKGTWTVLLDADLGKRGLEIMQIEPVDYGQLYEKGASYLNEIYGEQMANYYIDKSNINNVIPHIPEFLQHVHHQTRRSNVEEVVGFLKQGKLVACELNSSILNNYPGFALHFVLLYRADERHVYMHDPGLPPYPERPVTLADFRKAYAFADASMSAHVYSLS